MCPGSDSTLAPRFGSVAPPSACSKEAKASRVAPNSARPRKSRVKGVRQPLLSLIPQLILASININGLCPETEWGVSSLLKGQHYDVSTVSPFTLYIPPLIRFSV